MATRLVALQWLRRRASLPFLLLFHPIRPCGTPHSPSGFVAGCKIMNHMAGNRLSKTTKINRYAGCRGLHMSYHLNYAESNTVEPQKSTGNKISIDETSKPKMNRKKLKGKRAVVRWLKYFRWKKKKEYERMTAEEKLLYKLKKARRKQERLVAAMDKIKPSEMSEITHDPEILTPEEHFYFLKIGHKCKNYVPVGRRGIFQGVILNMHLHWKKHETLKVVVKTYTAEEVREIATELARLSGGIVLDIVDDNTIIMYRGKNYSQPPTEIMSPKVTLTRKKALDKSKYRDALRAVQKFIPRLEQDLQNLHQQLKRGEDEVKTTNEEETTEKIFDRLIAETRSENVDDFDPTEVDNNELDEEGSLTESEIFSESEDLSDIFSTDSDMNAEEKADQRPLFLDQFEKFPSLGDQDQNDFEEHLRQISAASGKGSSLGKDVNISELDEIDKIFLRASSLLKRKRR